MNTASVTGLRRALLGGAGALLALLVAGHPVAAQAGTRSGLSSVTLGATRNASITVSTSSATLTLAGGITDNSSANQFPALTITTTWSLTGGTLYLAAYFASTTQALANGTSIIPPANVEGKLTVNSTWQSFAGGINAWGVAIGPGTYTGTRTDGFDVRLNLIGAPATTAGTYTGTLNLRAFVL